MVFLLFDKIHEYKTRQVFCINVRKKRVKKKVKEFRNSTSVASLESSKTIPFARKEKRNREKQTRSRP